MIKKRDSMKSIVEVIKKFKENKRALSGTGFRTVFALIITAAAGIMFFWLVFK